MPERIIAQHLHARRRGTAAPIGPLSVSPGYLAPDQTAGDLGSLWSSPAPTTASRLPPVRSRGISRAAIVDPTSHRVIVCESALELACAQILLTDPRVKHVQDQPPSVTYLRPDGTHHRHTFDFLTMLADGQRVAIAVKPAAKVESSGIQKTVALIERQSNGAFADRFIIRTEQHMTRDRAFNASWLLRARRSRNAADIHRMRHTVAGTRGSISMGDLVRFSGLGARGWDALVHLVDEGTMELVRLVRFSDAALVRHHPTKHTREAASA